METNFNFKSAICTSREQSERLLALGLKKETADMVLTEFNDGSWRPTMTWIEEPNDYDASLYPEFETIDIPAWSLHRLWELIPNEIHHDGGVYVKEIKWNTLFYMCDDGDGLLGIEGNLYDSIIIAIEWLIKEGYFNKEYLENGNS